MAKQKLIVISFDALIYEDIKYLSEKPSFKYMLENGSYVKRVKSIYPTLTYPCHVTMATGCYPDKHGVAKNTYSETVLKPTWCFEHSNVKCEDIMDVCKKNGLVTASVGWPVTGNHKSIDYLVNECWPSKKDAPMDEYVSKYMEQGTSREVIDEAVLPHLWLRYGRKQPQASFNLAWVSAEIIRKFKPDILTIHIGILDHFRHKTGVFSNQVNDGLDECEQMLSLIMTAAKDAGTFDDTNFVVTADHGHMNYSRLINLNCIFAENGLIKTDDEGNVVNYKAWGYSMGMSSQIHLSDPDDRELYEKVYKLLKEKRDEGVWGISEVYTREDTREMHLDGDFSFIVEGDDYTKFTNKWTGKISEPVPLGLAGCVRGDHGFLPEKGPRPPFVACGPAIKKGVVLESADLVDGAPTYAKILGTDLPLADGKVIDDILK